MRRLVLMLALTGLVAATAARADDEVTHPFDTSASLRGVRRVIIDIPAGSFTVRNGAGATLAMKGTVRRSYDGWRERDKNQRIVDDITPIVTIRGQDAIVTRRFGDQATGWSARNKSVFEMNIDIPAGMSVEFDTRFGEVHMDGSFGNVDVDMNAGEIHLRTPRSAVRELAASCRVGEVHSNLGDRTIESEGLFPRTTRFTNPNGGRGDVKLHVTAGEVHVNLVP